MQNVRPQASLSRNEESIIEYRRRVSYIEFPPGFKPTWENIYPFATLEPTIATTVKPLTTHYGYLYKMRFPGNTYGLLLSENSGRIVFTGTHGIDDELSTELTLGDILIGISGHILPFPITLRDTVSKLKEAKLNGETVELTFCNCPCFARRYYENLSKKSTMAKKQDTNNKRKDMSTSNDPPQPSSSPSQIPELPPAKKQKHVSDDAASLERTSQPGTSSSGNTTENIVTSIEPNASQPGTSSSGNTTENIVTSTEPNASQEIIESDNPHIMSLTQIVLGKKVITCQCGLEIVFDDAKPYLRLSFGENSEKIDIKLSDLKGKEIMYFALDEKKIFMAFDAMYDVSEDLYKYKRFYHKSSDHGDKKHIILEPRSEFKFQCLIEALRSEMSIRLRGLSRKQASTFLKLIEKRRSSMTLKLKKKEQRKKALVKLEKALSSIKVKVDALSERLEAKETVNQDINIDKIVRLLFFVEDTNKGFSLQVNLNDTVCDVKKKIMNQEKIPMEQQCLLWKDNELLGNRKLCVYGIRENSMLCMKQCISLCQSDVFMSKPENKGGKDNAKVTIADADKIARILVYQKDTYKGFDLYMKLNETVGSLKRKIMQQENVPTEEQCLLWKDDELKDRCKIYEYGICDNSTVFMKQCIFCD